MAVDDYIIEPPGPLASPGPGVGEYIIELPPGAGGQVVQPPGLDVQAAAQTARDAVRAAGSTGTFGVGNVAVGAAKTLFGAEPDIVTAVNRMDERERAARLRSPVATVAGDIMAGGVTGGGLARVGISAVPAMARTGRAALGSMIDAGGYSALQGAGHTRSDNVGDYFKNAATAAAYGAPFGILAPGAGVVGEGAYRGLASQRGIPARLLESARADAPGLQEIVAGTRGPNAMLPDVGFSMRGTAQGAVLDPKGQGQRDLITNLTLRNEGVPQRVAGSVDRIFGPAEVPSHIQRDVVAPQVEALTPHYQTAYQNARAVNTEPIANWLDSEIPNATGQARAQLQRIRRDLEIEGAPGNLDPYAGKLGAIRSDITGMLRQDAATPGGTMQDNTRRLLQQAERHMTGELQRAVPGIHGLDSMRAELGAQERALATDSPGSRIFDTSREGVIRPAEMQDFLARSTVPKGVLTQTEEPLRLRQAARAELDRIVGTNKNDLNALERVLAEPQDYNSQKLAMMFGQDRADAIASVLRNERRGRETHTAVVGGSQTAQRSAAMKGLDEASGRLGLSTSPTGLIARGFDYAKDKLFSAQAASQRDRIANYLAATDQAEVRRRAQELLAAQPSRDARADLIRRLMQGFYTTGTAAGVVPKQ